MVPLRTRCRLKVIDRWFRSIPRGVKSPCSFKKSSFWSSTQFGFKSLVLNNAWKNVSKWRKRWSHDKVELNCFCSGYIIQCLCWSSEFNFARNNLPGQNWWISINLRKIRTPPFRRSGLITTNEPSRTPSQAIWWSTWTEAQTVWAGVNISFQVLISVQTFTSTLT